MEISAPQEVSLSDSVGEPRAPQPPPTGEPPPSSRRAATLPVVPAPKRGGVFDWLPGLWVLRHYQRAWLVRDVGAGLVLTSLLVPAGMGYAVAAGLPPINGLYATIVPLLAYAIVGPSRILVLGPDSALAAMIAAAVVAPAAGSPEKAVALASVLAILTGLLSVVGGVAKLGFITDLLSKPVRVGYMNGIGLTVLVAQLPKLLGFSVKADGVLDGAYELGRGVFDGRVKPEAVGIGTACLALILVGKATIPRVPMVLVAVVLATGAVTLFGWGERISIVGHVPRGIPLPAWPNVTLHEIGELFTAALGIALVAFADTSVISRTFAARGGYRVDSNRELVGLGLANVAGGFFQGFPVSSSASRTPVAEAAGARSQVTGIVGAVAITLLLVAAPTLMQNLPTTALAAIVIAAAIQILDVRVLHTFYRVRRSDFVLSIVAFVAVAALGVLQGIAIAIGVSLLDFVRNAWRPHDAVLGRAKGVKGYHDLRRYPGARQIPGLVLFRWDAPLFFANAETFRERVVGLVDGASVTPRWIVVCAEPITDVDTTASEMLHDLDAELTTRGVELTFAELKDPVKDRLERYDLKRKIGESYFFATIGVAVKTYIAKYDVDWEDWEDE